MAESRVRPGDEFGGKIMPVAESDGTGMPGAAPMLEFRDVRFQYDSDDFPIIDRLSFKVKKGEFVSVIGPSGCGKSTIFRLVNRLLMPAEGEILVNGEPVGAKSKSGPGTGKAGARVAGAGTSAGENGGAKASGAAARKLACGYMPQQDLLFPWRTVAENVRIPLEIRGGLSAQEMDRMTEEVLESVGLTGWGQKAPKELSGGMRQRAAFARTLLTGADLLLLDEPFSALDYLTRLSMREWLLSQWEQGQKTVLFITHDVEEAIFLSTRILAVEEMPITRLRSFDVPLTHPRSVESLNAPEALALKDELIALLRKTPGNAGGESAGITAGAESKSTADAESKGTAGAESKSAAGAEIASAENVSGKRGGIK